MKTKVNNQRAIAILSVLAGLIYSVSLIYSVIDGVTGRDKDLHLSWESIVGQEYGAVGTKKSYDFRTQKLLSNDQQFVNTVKNLKTGKNIPIRYSEVDVIVPDELADSPSVVIVFVFFMLTMLVILPTLFIMPYMFYKLMYDIYKGNIFTQDNVDRLNVLGWITVIALVLISIFGYLNSYNTNLLVELENYRVVRPNFQILIGLALYPITILIAAQVLKKAMLMKEEQDLTI